MIIKIIVTQWASILVRRVLKSEFDSLQTSMAVLLLIVTLVWTLPLLEPISGSYQPVYPPEDDNDNDTRVDLYLALTMSFGFGGAFNSSGTVPGIQIAIDLINNQPNLLPGYKLHYTLMDSQVH